MPAYGMRVARMRRLRIALLVGLAALGLAFLAVQRRGPATDTAASTLQLIEPEHTLAFTRALEPKEFSFPLDHGPHLGYQTEWWYYTGNLDTEAGEHYGFQLTFFRRGLSPGASRRTSDLATDQIYFAHFAISDVDAGKHVFAERFSRDALGLAGASGDPYTVWLETWRIDSLDPQGGSVRLRADQADMAIDLTLSAVKPIVMHGDRGLSRKGGSPGNASYYLSYTRMETQGRLVLGGQETFVRGLSWFDHEWSTSALPPKAVGWDWFSLQLNDGREVMLFQIRNADGSVEPSSAGTLVEADGHTRLLTREEVDLEPLDTWRSPISKGVYPTVWQVIVPSAGIDLTVEPWLEDQEVRLSFPYWEGAVRITDTGTGRVIGQGFVELTGYVESMQGVF